MNVLLVEDDAPSAAVVRRALHFSGVRAHLDLVYDGVEAVEFLYAIGSYKWRASDARIDAVIIDLDIPRLSGLELMGVLRLHPATRRIPLVVLASSAEDERIADSERFSPDGIVRKPVAWMDLVKVLRTAWGSQRRGREPLPGRIPGSAAGSTRGSPEL
ncbi:MAG TPA: response regulator [bacterium]|nr:response regulator [bacterium]